jgi:TonB-dependent SusC/RagA subfamily outer membrane receptor
MKNYYHFSKDWNPFNFKKIFLIIKLITLLLLINILQINAAGFLETGQFNLLLDKTSIKEAPTKEVLQQRKLTGTVVDETTGESLIGVTILINGTTQGTVTDVNGKFNLTLPSANAKLKVSYMGYLTQTIDIKGQARIDIKLKADVKSLDEVVVVGYGTVKKSDLTGSVTSIPQSRLKELPVTNVLQAIQGAVSGINVVQASTVPGSTASVIIRGVNSISASSNPLYVVDGVPLMSGSMNDINPNDIASIEVLKDPSSVAIYGTRGSNGVILYYNQTRNRW